MYTQCPKCETCFRVTDEDLDAADGQVRCSRCEAVFDGRAQLLTRAQERALDPATLGLEPKIGDLFGAEGADGGPADADPAFGDAFDAPGGSEHADAFDRAADDARDDAAATQAPRFDLGDLPPPLVLPDAGRPRPRALPWAIACAALALALGAQWVHANREPLVRDPALGPLIADAYQRLRLPLRMPTDLARLSVERADVTSHPVYKDVLYITATVTNEAAFPQPLPLLRVRLDDRWGEPVGVRLFRPDEYLRQAEPSGRADPGRTYAVALEVLDPGNEAVGYALTPCLPQGESLVCLGDG